MIKGLAAAGLIWLVALSGATAADEQFNSCCADVEERLAELERAVAHAGPRQVHLQIYGQVNHALMFWDNGGGSDLYVVDNDTASSRFGIKGSANIGNGWSAGYKIEAEFQSADSNRVGELSDDFQTINLRRSFWILKSKKLGKLYTGLVDTANAGVAEIDVSGTSVVAISGGLQWGGGIAIDGLATRQPWGSVTRGNYEFNRKNVIRYDTPAVAGFIATAAWGEDDLWDVALRHASATNGFTIAGGIAYGEVSDNSVGCARAQCRDRHVLNGSFSALHEKSGLFVTAAAGQRKTKLRVQGAGLSDETFWHVRSGFSRRIFDVGRTAIYAEAHGWQNDAAGQSVSTGMITGGGIVQRIDDAALELYVGVRQFEADLADIATERDMTVVLTGGRLKF